jgi:hypothetical protein
MADEQREAGDNDVGYLRTHRQELNQRQSSLGICDYVRGNTEGRNH